MTRPLSALGLTLISGAITAALVPPLRRLAPGFGFVDPPAARKHHSTATPLLGGLAIGAGIYLPPWFGASAPHGLPALAGAAALLAVVGLLDDRRALGVVVKLGAQVVAALAVILAGVVTLPGAVSPGIDVVVLLVWLVGITNALNLLDNVDGLAAATAAATALGLLGIAGSAGAVGVLAFGVLGASLGFLVFNWAPARIFMGDAGSLPLGFTLAVLALAAADTRDAPLAWLLPILLLALPIADTVTVCVSRLGRGLNPFTHPGTDHLSHRLIRRGMKVPAAVTLLVLGALAVDCVAWWLAAAGAPDPMASP